VNILDNPIRLIDTALLDEVSAEARNSPRGRRNRNFHRDDAQPANRLLNAIEPGSYVMPHRHLDPNKDETMVVLRGRLGLVEFDDGGGVAATRVLGPGLDALGVDIPHGTWHTVFALEPGTVFFEAKAGPYLPLTRDEKPLWAPAEGTPEVAAYQARLVALLS
jgi:cupin fold WbuC family metalloprotein